MATPFPTTLESALGNLIQTYHDLNSPLIDELASEPSALEFMRYVAKNRPFVVRKGAASWPAVQLWNINYLEEIMRSAHVNVANTPYGNADAIATNPKDGLPYFVKPFEHDEPFSAFLADLQTQELSRNLSSNVKYAQTRDPPFPLSTPARRTLSNRETPENDNLRNEYAPLFADVERDIAWARIALHHTAGPDAINLWIGNSRSVTALHRDNYENVYVQVVGEKHFVLVPPVETACVMEKRLPGATYAKRDPVEKDGDSGPDASLPGTEELEIIPDAESDPVPCATWDPDQPSSGVSSLSRPMRVTLNAGDMLYLPSLWYHKVSQSCGPEGICVAVNYWYDMDFEGFHYASNAFIRDVVLATATANANNSKP